MNLAGFGVKNSLLVNLLAVFLVVAGGLSAISIQREAFPNFSFDVVSISTKYPGAGPETVESLITQPIEDELSGVSDLDEISSVSAEGISLIVAKIDPDATDKSRVVDDIRQAVSRVIDFPSDLQDRPSVTEIRSQDQPILEIALAGDHTRQDLQMWGRILEDMLQEIPEVASVARNGWLEEQVIVTLKSDSLQRFDVSIQDVTSALRSRHINIPQGSIDQKDKELFVRTNLEFRTPQDLEDVVIKANLDGHVVRLRDVATVAWGFERATKILRANGNPAISLIVIKRASADILKMVKKINATLQEFQSLSPDTPRVRLINDVSVYVSNRLNILYSNGLIGIILVVISLFVFLDRRIGFWTSLGIPVAFACGFWMMKQFGVTLNLISMFGLIIVLGMVVDDSIVVAESVYQKIERGMHPRQAAIEGTREVMLPVFMTVSTTTIFFLPLMFMSGILGKFVSPIPIVVSVTLLGSLIECFLILPSHLAFSRPHHTPRENRLFIWMRSIYEPLIRRILRYHFVVTPMAGVILIGIITWGLSSIPIIMFPGRDIEIFFIRAKAPIGTTFSQTQMKFEAIESIARNLPSSELKDVVTQIGIIQQDPNDPFTQRGSHVGQVAVYLTRFTQRERSTSDIMADLRTKLSGISGFESIWIDEIRPGPPQGKPINIRIRGNDTTTALKVAQQVKDRLAGISGVLDPTHDFEVGKQELRYNLSEQKAAQMGINLTQAGLAIRTAIEGEVIGVIRGEDENHDIVVKLAPSDLLLGGIESLRIRNGIGRSVPLQQVLTKEPGESLNFVKHLDEKRVISVTANVDEAMTTAREVAQRILPTLQDLDRANPQLQIRLEGENKDTDESLESLLRAFILGGLACFFLLAAAFRSLIQPVLILMAVPFGLASSLIALYLHQEPLSFLAFLGLVGLSGVAVNDSIVLIDRLNSLRNSDTPLLDRVAQGAASRVRAVLLTTITTVLGIGPLAYGIGGQDLFLKPMAIVIAWGLGFGTLLTLILIPCAYASIESLRYRLWGAG